MFYNNIFKSSFYTINMGFYEKGDRKKEEYDLKDTYEAYGRLMALYEEAEKEHLKLGDKDQAFKMLEGRANLSHSLAEKTDDPDIRVQALENELGIRERLGQKQKVSRLRKQIDEFYREKAIDEREYQLSSGFDRRLAEVSRPRTAAAAAILSFIGSLLFLSAGITGNAIAGLSRSNMNIISLVLFLVALISSILYSRIRDKQERQ